MYDAKSVNSLAASVLKKASVKPSIVLMTDRIRPDVAPYIHQELIPESFRNPRFFGGGYPVKLAAFGLSKIPQDTPCVFLDLDSVVLGDLTAIARLVSPEKPCFMLNSGTTRFNALSRALHRLTAGRRFVCGNSSVIAFHTSIAPSIPDAFLQHHTAAGDVSKKYLQSDDQFISWYLGDKIRSMPDRCAVMFRREFLSRFLWWTTFKARLPTTKSRRQEITVVTLNGEEFKPERLLSYPDGHLIVERKGRRGAWNTETFGDLKHRILQELKALS
ncbi:hypothetical protein [Shimia sp.]|uniref:hypothetical protein n=1 Tax=Shimia sp. TaxID=1954381 RepID=UPI003BAC44C0